eukprot:gene5820-8026_t
MDEIVEEDLTYKDHAEQLKDEGNAAFQSGDVALAANYFTQAIEMDPDNHVYYSNRSAAYLKLDFKSKALKDAEKCVELAPDWAKGYNRLGVAQQSLTRFIEAIDTFKKGIQLEPNNKSMWNALKACQEAYDNDKKKRFAAAAIERQVEEERIKLQDEIKKEKQNQKLRNEYSKKQENVLSDFFSELSSFSNSNNDNNDNNNNNNILSNENIKNESVQNPTFDNEDDILAGFFNEISSSTNKTEEKIIISEKPKNLTTEKYTNQDLGTSESNLKRLLGPHYQWRNLNPYEVLQLGIDATDDDIKNRYRKLSLKVHPDRLRNEPTARDAFEQVKDAYMKLCDEIQKKNIISNIERFTEEFDRERNKQLSKGISEKDLPNYEEELQRRVMKQFAEMESMRKRSERNIRAYSAREKMQEAEEIEKLNKTTEFDQKWGQEE